MDSSDQVIFALKVVLAVGPLALYFLALGLVNSQARPCIVSARSDFSLLAIAVVPVVATPVLILIEHGQMVTAAGVVLGLAVAFLSLLPKAGGSWVVYNCSPAQCRRLVRQACQALGWSLDQTDGDHWKVMPSCLRLRQSALPWLRSITLQVVGPRTEQSDQAQAELLVALKEELFRETMLPSATGVSLVVIGASLLGLPLWYFFHHIKAIVDVVERIFSV